MNERPALLVTRKLPQAVLDRAARDYEAKVNADDRLYGPDEIVELARDCDSILIC